MMEGKVNAALRLLTDGDDAGVLSLNETISENGPSVRDALKEKHPEAKPFRDKAIDKSLETESPTEIHPVFFDRITGATFRIRSAALHLSGSAGPSGLDAAGWRRLCVSFHAASKDLCNAIAALARAAVYAVCRPRKHGSFRRLPLDTPEQEPGWPPHWRVRMLAETCCQSPTFDHKQLCA